MKYKEEYNVKEKFKIISVGPEKSRCTVEIPNNINKIAEGNFIMSYLKMVTLPNNIETR